MLVTQSFLNQSREGNIVSDKGFIVTRIPLWLFKNHYFAAPREPKTYAPWQTIENDPSYKRAERETPRSNTIGGSVPSKQEPIHLKGKISPGSCRVATLENMV